MTGSSGTVATAGRLVDARTGIIRRVEHRPVPSHFPASFGLVAARLSDAVQFGGQATDATAAGCGFGDDRQRVLAAVGEAVERYCAALVPPSLPVTSWARLTAAGHDVVDPDRLALFSEAQYARSRFPFEPLTRNTETAWAAGVDMTTRAAVMAPASLAWATHGAAAGGGGRPTNPIVQAGLAAGPTVGWARANALQEVIERDAMTLGWHGRRGLVRLDPPSWLTRMAAGPEGALVTRFYAFPNEFHLPVVGALVHDGLTGYLSFGTAGKTDPVAAAVKALGEALQLQLVLAQFDDPEGPVAHAAKQAASPLKPWRADRGYLQSYREDLTDVVDYGCHLQLFLDPVLHARVGAELEEATAGRSRLTGLPGCSWAQVLAAVGDAGHRAVAVDLTTDDIASCGLHVARVLVPGCYSNGAAGLPFLGGTRLAACLGSSGHGRRALPLPH